MPNTADLEEGLFMAGLAAHYSARDIEARILAAVRAAGLNPEQRLSPEELGALDHFHTGGLRASRELLELAQIRAELFEDTSDAHLSRTTADAAPSPLTLGVYVDNLAQKAGNARRSLQESQIRLVRGVFRVK